MVFHVVLAHICIRAKIAIKVFNVVPCGAEEQKVVLRLFLVL